MDFKLKDFVEEDSRAYFVGVRYLEHRQNTLTPAGGLPENGAPTGVCEGPASQNLLQLGERKPGTSRLL